MIKNLLILFIILFSCGTAFSQGSQSVPVTQFKQYVEDQTGTLTSQQLQELRQRLEAFDKQTSTQIVVYMIPSLDGESLEDISMQLAEKNKIGKKDKNNGVLMLVVKDDRKIRIEVGYGLEGALTDATSSQIIRKDITPYFKSGDYYEGINSGVDAIIAVTKGEYTADKKSGKDDNDTLGTCCGLPIVIVIIFVVIFIMIVFSIISRIMGFGKSAVFGNRKKSNWYWGGGGFGGGSSGGFGGGGGFSGGGGSFGGGGASGSW